MLNVVVCSRKLLRCWYSINCSWQRADEFRERQRQSGLTEVWVGNEDATSVLLEQLKAVTHAPLSHHFQMTQPFPPHPHPVSLRFGTKGLSISFVSTESDAKKLEEVQSRFEVDIPELPDTIETSTYMQAAT